MLKSQERAEEEMRLLAELEKDSQEDEDGRSPPDPLPAAKEEPAVATKTEMAVQSYLLPIFGGAALMVMCWGLGRFGYSIGWIWIFIALNFFKSQLWRQQQKRLLRLRQTALEERKVIEAQLQDLPAWVQFPDTERVEWINKVILQLWPYIGEYTKKFMKEFIEPQVKAQMPGPFKSFRFVHMDMGDIPLRVGGMKVYTENVGRDRVIMDMDVAYAGDCDFVVSVGAFRGGLNNMQFVGKLRAVLQPLLPYPPMVGGVSAFFLDDPVIDFNLTGMGELVELPGLMNAIRSVVTTQVRSICVLPNQIVVPLTAETDIARLHFPEPDGALRVHLVEAKNLENRDISFIKKGKSDPYACVSVGAQVFKTETVDNDLNPKWNEFFEAVVDQASGQKLKLEVFDDDPGSNDEELGRLSLELSAIREKGVVDAWYQLEGAKHGDIHLKLYWMNLSCEQQDLQQNLWESEWLKAKEPLHPAILMVYIDNVSGLPYPKHNLEPSPFVEVRLGNETQKTYPKPKTVNPLYQQKFIFWVSDPDHQKVAVEGKDDSSGRSLGELEVPLRTLLTEKNMELYQQTWNLSLGAHYAPIVMTLRLRFLKPGGDGSVHLLKTEDTNDVQQKTLRPVEIHIQNDTNDLKSADPGDGSVSILKQTGGQHLRTPPTPGSPSSLRSATSTASRRRSNSFLHKFKHKKLTRRKESYTGLEPGDLGRLELVLWYNFQRNRLVVTVNQAEALHPVSMEGTADPYVKLRLLFDGEKTKEKRKTFLAEDTLNPVYEQAFEFDIHHDALAQYSLDVRVKDAANYGLFNKTPVLGKFMFSLQEFDSSDRMTDWFNLELGVGK